MSSRDTCQSRTLCASAVSARTADGIPGEQATAIKQQAGSQCRVEERLALARGVRLHKNARLARRDRVLLDAGNRREVWIGSTSEAISVASIGLPSSLDATLGYRCRRQIMRSGPA